MATIVTRSGKGSPLTHAEVDANFTNLNTDKLELSGGTMTGNLSFGDNDKAIFGAGSDLEIYSDGTTGQITGDVNITGTLTSDGLTVNSGTANQVATFSSTDAGAFVYIQDDNALGYYHGASNGQYVIRDTDNKSRIVVGSGGDISFYDDQGSSQSFFWDASAERLGIGTSLPSYKLSIQDTGDTYFQIGNGTYNTYIGTQANETYIGNDAVKALSFLTQSTERMRIDSGGDLLLGKTTAASTTAGMHLDTNGKITTTRSSGPAAAFVRLTSDGDIVTFQKDSTTVGRIGTVGGDLWLGSSAASHAAIRFANGSMFPVSNTGGSSDGLVDIGDSSARFKDLYLSGSIHGDVKFENNAGTTEYARFDSDGNLLLGTTSVQNQTGTTQGTSLYGNMLTVGRATGASAGPVVRLNSIGTGSNEIIDFRKDGTTVGSIVADAGDLIIGTGITGLRFNDAANEVIPRNTSGVQSAGLTNLGNSSSRFKDLYLSGSIHGDVKFENNAGTTEYARFDSSGNLLVGRTATGYANTGAQFAADGAQNIFVADGDYALGLGRKTDDGDILQFRKDGTTVGSIGASFGDLTIGTGDTGLKFYDFGDAVFPTDPSTNSNRDAAVDLGLSSVRFKDLYLSGGIEIENGTGNVGVGKQALNSNTASNNTAVGYQALYDNTTGDNHVAIGYTALSNNTTGIRNVIIGNYAGNGITTQSNNVALGYGALNVATGESNTCIGGGAGGAMTTGSKNTILGRYNGNQGGLDISTSSNRIVLSDGDGNPRIYVDDTGEVKVGHNTSIGDLANGASGDGISFGVATQTGTFKAVVSRSDAAACFYASKGASPTDNRHISFYRNSSQVGSITTSSSSTSYNTSSDHRLKENVVDLTGATTRLKQLAPKRFNFIEDADTTVDGFLAHEVQGIVPEAVHGEHNEVDDDGNPVYQGIDQSKLVPLLVATIKELEARITALENA